jgi:hypothetical protein
MGKRTAFFRILAAGFWIATASGCTAVLDGMADEGNVVTRQYSEPAAGEQALRAEVDLKVGDLQVSPGSPDQIYDLELRYNEHFFRPVVDFRRDNTEAELNIGFEGEGRSSFRRMSDNLIRLKVSPEAALDLTANTGVGTSTFDLGGLRLQSLNLQTGVGETKLSMLQPNRGTCDRVEISAGVGEFELVGLGNLGFQSFRFRGGVGESTLDFSGDWNQIGEIRVEVGVGEVTLRIPRSVGAEIRMNKGFFSDANLPDFRKEGNTYFSENLERVDKVIRFRVQAGIGGVSVRWM